MVFYAIWAWCFLESHIYKKFWFITSVGKRIVYEIFVCFSSKTIRTVESRGYPLNTTSSLVITPLYPNRKKSSASHFPIKRSTLIEPHVCGPKAMIWQPSMRWQPKTIWRVSELLFCTSSTAPKCSSLIEFRNSSRAQVREYGQRHLGERWKWPL